MKNRTEELSLIKLGKQYSEDRKFEEALKLFQKALAEDKTQEEVHFEIGKVYYFQGKYDEAVIEFLDETKLNPGYKFVHMFLGMTYIVKLMYEKAVEEFCKVLELNNTDKGLEKQIHELMTRTYLLQGKHELAIEEINRLMILDPSKVTAYTLALSIIHKMLGKNMEAAKIYDKAMEIIESEKSFRPETISLGRADDLKAANKLLNEKEIAGSKTSLSSKVRSLLVNLTNRCNLSCTMCWLPYPPFIEMSGKVKQEIVKTFPYLEDIMWLGGEVFLDSDIDEMIDEAIKYKVKQTITTNALLLDEKKLTKFVENNINLRISIDGTTKEVYENIRRGASFEVLLEKLAMINRIKKAVNPKYEIYLNIVVSRSNYHQIESFVDFAKEHGFYSVNYILMNENYNNQNIFSPDRDDKILGEVHKSINKARERCKEYGLVFVNSITEELFQNKVSDKDDENVICLSPWRRAIVVVSGDVIPGFICFCRNVVGNLNDSTFDEIWNGERIVEYRRTLLEGNVNKICGLKNVYGRVPIEPLVQNMPDITCFKKK
jgi:MoaA/NifB/PqqE/SkfB family radical SAM enzyme/Tfp pilus assembly protein PilF